MELDTDLLAIGRDIDDAKTSDRCHRYSLERLHHFRCWACNRWWSIGDPEQTPDTDWYCPWCGTNGLALPVNESESAG